MLYQTNSTAFILLLDMHTFRQHGLLMNKEGNKMIITNTINNIILNNNPMK